MAKLNKANTTGSVSIILPKSLVNALGWEVGDYCSCKICETGGITINKTIKVEKKERPKKTRRRRKR